MTRGNLPGGCHKGNSPGKIGGEKMSNFTNLIKALTELIKAITALINSVKK